jgi:hypothetical protein
MPQNVSLNLEKFGSIGGDYFEHLVAVALDELGYEEGKTYLPSWAKKCVPGTWIEADFIISPKSDKSGDPLNRGRIVLAIGHATSEDSARMKFHRDVEQLLEVKALANGDEYRVMDILFCCQRETMGGWSKELVAINEAIFDNSLIVWKRDWGMRLLQQIQLHGEKLTQGDNAAKKRRLKNLLTKYPAFQRQFNELRDQLGTMLADKKSHSRIGDIFIEERKQLPVRLSRPLLITKPETTDFKRGLLQVLALNPWEVELLHLNHEKNGVGKFYPLEKLALEQGMSQADFDKWWKRLELLSIKYGTSSAEFLDDEILDNDAKEWRAFKASNELGYVFRHFPKTALAELSRNIVISSPNLAAYCLELRDLDRVEEVLDFLRQAVEKRKGEDFYEGLCEHFASRSFLSRERQRLTLLEVAMAAVCVASPKFSYDKLAKESGHPDWVANPNQFRRYPKLQGDPRQEKFAKPAKTLFAKLCRLGEEFVQEQRHEIVRKFIARALDGMVKQPRAGQGALDVLLKETILSFSKEIGASLKIAVDYEGEASAFSAFVGSTAAGVNVEVPYVLSLTSGEKILIHRVMADGGVGHKRKEFASKIRTIRYKALGTGFERRNDIFATVIVLDGNWVTPELTDKLTPFRMLTVAGWDYVVYPDQLAQAFALIEKDLEFASRKTSTPLSLSEDEDLAMAAEEDAPQKFTKRRKSSGR